MFITKAFYRINKMKTQKEMSLEYYRQNRNIINQRRREKYGEKERKQAKERFIIFREKHGKEYFLKYRGRYKYQYKHKVFKRRGLSYIEWKDKYPQEYKKMLFLSNLCRKRRYYNNIEYRNKEVKRCVKNSIIRIHNSRVSGVKLTKQIIDDVYIKYNHTCVNCLKTNKETKLSLDHIKPISKGGTNNINNLQILCLHCNQSKHNKY